MTARLWAARALPASRRLEIPAFGGRRVARHARALLIHRAKPILRGREAERGGAFEPVGPQPAWSFGSPLPSNSRVASSYCAAGLSGRHRVAQGREIPGGIAARSSLVGGPPSGARSRRVELGRRLDNRGGRGDVDRFAARLDRAGVARRLACRRVELCGLEFLFAQLGAPQKRRPDTGHSYRERRGERDRDAEQYGAPVSWRRTPLRSGLRALRTARVRNSQESARRRSVGGAAAFRQRRLRGAAGGCDVDADRRIGLGSDHLREFAGFARPLRRARAGLDEEVLAVGGLSTAVRRRSPPPWAGPSVAARLRGQAPRRPATQS